MQYRSVPHLTREMVQRDLKSEDSVVRRDALLSAAFYDPDWHWVQDACLEILARAEDPLKALAITCLGHIARIHGVIDLSRVMPVLTELSRNPELASYVSDTITYDFEMYLGRNQPVD